MEIPSIFLNRVLSEVAKNGASSLHLSAGSAPMIRIDGKFSLMESEGILTSDLLKKIIDSFVEDKEKEILEEKREVVLVRILPGNLRFRINIFYQKDMPSISFNYIEGIIRHLANLNLPQQAKDFIRNDSGLLIVAGPNDSGRTSTIASFIEETNKDQKKYIITLEKPIEHPFINKQSMIEQRQVGRDVKTYKDGLLHCLEEDVDLVYINETNKEFNDILPIILELASGNCLVILELNAEDSVRAIERFLKSSSSEAVRHTLADVLIGVITQKLLQKVGGGMILAPEVLVVTSPVKSLIREGNIYKMEGVIQTSRGEGMISMRKSIETLVSEDRVSRDELNKLREDK